MKKIIASILAVCSLVWMTGANAHGWRGGYGGGFAPFTVGVLTGLVVSNAYYRPYPSYYAQPQPAYYPPVYYQPHAAAFCPENGLYYPQTQACPSGWQKVLY